MIKIDEYGPGGLPSAAVTVLSPYLSGTMGLSTSIHTPRLTTTSVQSFCVTLRSRAGPHERGRALAFIAAASESTAWAEGTQATGPASLTIVAGCADAGDPPRLKASTATSAVIAAFITSPFAG